MHRAGRRGLCVLGSAAPRLLPGHCCKQSQPECPATSQASTMTSVSAPTSPSSTLSLLPTSASVAGPGDSGKPHGVAGEGAGRAGKPFSHRVSESRAVFVRHGGGISSCCGRRCSAVLPHFLFFIHSSLPLVSNVKVLHLCGPFLLRVVNQYLEAGAED